MNSLMLSCICCDHVIDINIKITLEERDSARASMKRKEIITLSLKIRQKPRSFTRLERDPVKIEFKV